MSNKRRKYGEGGMVARDILKQLGGVMRLNAMTGAYNFIDKGNGVSFRIKNAQANYIQITRNPSDLYDLVIGRIRGIDFKIVAEQNNIYEDQLKGAIERATGKRLSLAEGGIFADGGDIGDMQNIAKILVISNKKPLSSQLSKETGDGYNMSDYEEKNFDNMSVIRHYTSGKTFVVFPKTFIEQVDNDVVEEDLNYIEKYKIFGIEGFDFSAMVGYNDDVKNLSFIDVLNNPESKVIVEQIEEIGDTDDVKLLSIKKDLINRLSDEFGYSYMEKGGSIGYKIGDKYSSNFDYKGMFAMGMKSDVSWGFKKLRKLADSFTDVNYISDAKYLYQALKQLEEGDVENARKSLEQFHIALENIETYAKGGYLAGEWVVYNPQTDKVISTKKSGAAAKREMSKLLNSGQKYEEVGIEAKSEWDMWHTDSDNKLAEGGEIMKKYVTDTGKVIYTKAKTFEEFKKQHSKNYSHLRKLKNGMMERDWKQIESQFANGGSVGDYEYKTIASFEDFKVNIYDGKLGFEDLFKATGKMPKNIEHIEVTNKFGNDDFGDFYGWSKKEVERLFGCDFEQGFPVVNFEKNKDGREILSAFGVLENGVDVEFDKQILEWVTKFENGGEISKEDYNMLLREYDKVGGILEDEEDEVKRTELIKQLNDIESRIHRYERKDEYAKKNNTMDNYEVYVAAFGKERVIADSLSKDEALDFIYNYKLSHPRAKLDYKIEGNDNSNKYAKGGEIQRNGTYTGRIVKTDSGEVMVGKISGYRGSGEPVYDVHEFSPLRKTMLSKKGELGNNKIKELLKPISKRPKYGEVDDTLKVNMPSGQNVEFYFSGDKIVRFKNLPASERDTTVFYNLSEEKQQAINKHLNPDAFAEGGQIADFEQKVKDAMKVENKWHFINETVDGKDVQLKMFVGKKEVDVQIFKINGRSGYAATNYGGKRATLKTIMDNFNTVPKMADGGKVGGRGWDGLEKGERITDIKELKKGKVYLEHSPQFNANNLVKITGYDETGLNRPIVYGSFVRSLDGKNLEEYFSIWDDDLKRKEFYYPKNSASTKKGRKKYGDGGDVEAVNVFEEKPEIQLMNGNGVFDTVSNVSYISNVLVNGNKWFGARVEYDKKRKSFYLSGYDYSYPLLDKFKRYYNSEKELKEDVANNLVGGTYNINSYYANQVHIPEVKYENNNNITFKNGGLLTNGKYQYEKNDEGMYEGDNVKVLKFDGTYYHIVILDEDGNITFDPKKSVFRDKFESAFAYFPKGMEALNDLIEWCEENAPKLVNYYIKEDVTPDEVNSESDLVNKGQYFTECYMNEGGKQECTIQICLADELGDTVEDLQLNYASYVRYAEDISDGALLLDVDANTNIENDSVVFTFTVNDGGKNIELSSTEKARLDELQKKEDTDSLTKSENAEYEMLVEKYRQTKDYKTYEVGGNLKSAVNVERQRLMAGKTRVEKIKWFDGLPLSQKQDLFYSYKGRKINMTQHLSDNDKVFIWNKEYNGDYYKYAKGGKVDKLEQELHKLRRDLSSKRLSTYMEGDTSEEEMARQRERASKKARFDEVLRLLNERDK